MMTKKEATSDKGKTTMKRLLAVAAHLFRQHGFAATSTHQLAESLGMQKASLYHHMDKKEELLYLICVDALMCIQQAVDKAIDPLCEPEDRLRTLIRAHTLVALTDQDKFATALLDHRELSMDNQHTIMELQDHYEQTVQGVISECQDAGILRSDTSARHLTLLLLSMMNYSIFWYRPEGKLGPGELAALFTQQFIEGAQSGRVL